MILRWRKASAFTTKAVKYVARPLLAGTVDYSALCDQVTKVGMAPRGVVKMVTDGLIDAIMWNLENHLSVKLGDFGTFRPAFLLKKRLQIHRFSDFRTLALSSILLKFPLVVKIILRRHKTSAFTSFSSL